MNPNIEKVCFVIDSPMNALVASLIARYATHVDIIYVFDPQRKDIPEYLRVARALLSSLRIHSEQVIEFDSLRFWGGEKNDLLPAAHQALAPLIKQHPQGTVYFGNCLTNPVALALKRFAKVNHLYHAPSDFVSMLFPQTNPLKSGLKNLAKRILGRELYKIEIGDFPIYSLLNFASQKDFQYLDFNDFSSKAVESMLAELSRELDGTNRNVMLLLAGDEPEPGDNNHSNIAKYLQPHLAAVEMLMQEHGLQEARLWIKEHKSYLPLVAEERILLADGFSRLGCSVRFVADYLPKAYRLLPGECLLKYCRYDHIIAEPSSFLLNVSGSINAVAVVSSFAPYRNADQIGRNNELLKVNELLAKPCCDY
ncbi:hypothetical protein A9J41_12430 [Laribacter hongkongensis]|uniref:hypothetical protein n=1 Tax=Laribacter hongkongensis TaxID=168471 RepID=UPI0018784935|nr:hypothetical protein [Laribacter hongkongensis]MBE5528315.1 hypothetical protein [Laribacter hongkongensis]